MADFCKQCSIEIFGEDFKDLSGMIKKGFVRTICEGCGLTVVNELGECVSSECLKKHEKKNSENE